MEDVQQEPEGAGAAVTYRRLVFESSPTAVQTQCRLLGGRTPIFMVRSRWAGADSSLLCTRYPSLDTNFGNAG